MIERSRHWGFLSSILLKNRRYVRFKSYREGQILLKEVKDKLVKARLSGNEERFKKLSQIRCNITRRLKYYCPICQIHRKNRDARMCPDCKLKNGLSVNGRFNGKVIAI